MNKYYFKTSLFKFNLLVFFLILIVNILTTSTVCFGDTKTKVHLQNNTIYYDGDINHEANSKVFELYKSAKTKPSLLSINSCGGDIISSLMLGEWVFKNKFDVAVAKYCGGACANYVFPAGKKKILTKKATLFWFGGVSSFCKEGCSCEDCPSSQSDLMDAKRRYMQDEYPPLLDQETSFFKKIGVDQRISTFGKLEKYKKIPANQSIVIWDYSLEDLEKLGVKNIEVCNPPWKPERNYEGIEITRIQITTDFVEQENLK